MTGIHVYGISQCSTVKKARDWLDRHHLAYQFHDYKRTPPNAGQLKIWAHALGWQALLNRRGTTWRQLDKTTQDSIDNSDAAIALMLEKPSIIRRPVLEYGSLLLAGFDAAEWQQRLTVQPSDSLA